MTTLTVVQARPVAAQGTTTLPETYEVLLGPLSLYPQIALRDFGTDSNVYNHQNTPLADFTYTVTPRVFAVVPFAHSRLIGIGRGDLVYYRTYADQRSMTTSLEGRYEVVDSSFRPFVSVGSVITGDRSGYEIDARARSTQGNAFVGADFDVTPITALTAWTGRSTTTYDRSERYLSVSLADQLDHTTDIIAAGACFRFTETTTVVMAAETRRYRFDHSPLRDTDSLRLVPAVQIDPGGPISGDARAGYMRYSPRDVSVTGYQGFTGSARLHYALLSVTRFDFDANHDIAHSFDPLQPYYLESGGRVTVTQRVLGQFEIIGVGERRELRNQRIGGTSFDGRREVTRSVGGGVGFEVQRRVRIALTYERTRRVSSVPLDRAFERRRVFASASYGI